MPPETAKLLMDMKRAAERIGRFAQGKTFADYQEDDLLRSAIERQFEIIGEALGKAAEVDPSLAEQMPDLPRIVGLRLIHGYDSVDDEIVWDIVQTRIPQLIDLLEALLGKSGFPTEVVE